MLGGSFILSVTFRLLEGSGKTYPVNWSVATTEISMSKDNMN